MNKPPEISERISHKKIQDFVHRAGSAAGLPGEKAALLADLLTTNDLRGNFSHGSRQIAAYARLMADGRLNADPNIKTVKESGVSLLVDGDGGLGYFAAYEGTLAVIEKALESGIGVMVTRHHGHIGAAGVYARLPVEHDLLTFVTSGHQLNLRPGMKLYHAAGGSPMAFSAPADGGPPLVVDFGCMHDLYHDDPHRDEVAQLTPGLVLRAIGLGEICQTWGGFLAGLKLDPNPAAPRWPGANQGALVICFRIDLFQDTGEFKEEVTRYLDRIRTLSPIPPFNESFAAGVVEAAREIEYRENGIPVSVEHKEDFNSLAADLGIEEIS